MKRPQLRGLSRRHVQQLLSKTKPKRSAGDRIEVLSRQFLGLPYTINPLIGSANDPEIFVTSFKGFDCVTYVETVLALARAANPDDFVDELRKIRYQDGRIDYSRRNHYMTSWIRNNARAGAVREALNRARRVSKRRLLNVVPGLPPKTQQFECVPKPEVRRVIGELRTGDLIFFASTRSHIDVFHSGIVIKDGDRVLLRHASKSRNGVVEQDLSEFLKANRMAGVIVVRPREKT